MEPCCGLGVHVQLLTLKKLSIYMCIYLEELSYILKGPSIISAGFDHLVRVPIRPLSNDA